MGTDDGADGGSRPGTPRPASRHFDFEELPEEEEEERRDGGARGRAPDAAAAEGGGGRAPDGGGLFDYDDLPSPDACDGGEDARAQCPREAEGPRPGAVAAAGREGGAAASPAEVPTVHGLEEAEAPQPAAGGAAAQESEATAGPAEVAAAQGPEEAEPPQPPAGAAAAQESEAAAGTTEAAAAAGPPSGPEAQACRERAGSPPEAEPGLGPPAAVSYREHWERTAEAFVQMVLDIYRRECIGGQGWMEGMRRLIETVDRKGHDPGFDQYAGNLLRDHHVCNMCVHPWKSKFTRLLCRLETVVAEATKNLDLVHDWTLRPEVWGEASRQKARREGAIVNPPFGGFGFGQRSLLFVGLPLTLYLSDCPHLYTLVRRMRALSAQVPGTSVTPASVRALLDEGDRPYALLTFALLSSLQVLHAARLPRSEGCEGLEGLCATAVSGSGVAGWMSVASDQFATSRVDTPGCLRVSGGGSLIFRGIWITERVDNDRARYSWSFNSFSRSLEGVLSVLDFYSSPTVDSATAAVAREHSHILLYVARYKAENWAFPVQLYNSGAAADTEKEVLVPPFVQYRFVPGTGSEGSPGTWLEVDSKEPRSTWKAKLKWVEQRWGLLLEREAPLLAELLKGRGSKLYPLLDRDIRVTVRFVESIEPAEPILRLLGGRQHLKPDDMLLAFRPPAEPVALAGPHFISPERLGAGTASWHDFTVAIKTGDKEYVKGMQSHMASALRKANAQNVEESPPRDQPHTKKRLGTGSWS